MKVRDVTPWLPCPKCNAPVSINANIFSNYFDDDIEVCQNCKNGKLPEFIRESLNNNFMDVSAYYTIGANSRYFQIELVPELVFKLNLSEFGIPEDGDILGINYTPAHGGGLFPVELHGNQLIRRYDIPHIIHLYPRVMKTRASNTKVNVLVTWIKSNSISGLYLWDSLLFSVTNFCNRKYEQSILPANILIEAKLGEIINKFFKKRDENIRYHNNLNHILPLITKCHEIKLLPENILSDLNALKALRNQIAHMGRTKKPLGKEKMASYLSSVIIGFHYLLYLEKKLDLVGFKD